jgi:murein DD-endopeptidase MepM/ murein hydrolase activator NlpD
MGDFIDTFSDKIRILAGLMIVAFGLLLLPVFLSLPMANSKAQAAGTDSSNDNTSTNDSPNIITSGLFESTDKLSKFTGSAAQNVSDGVNATANSLATAAADSGKLVVHGVGDGATLVANGVGSSVTFAAHSTGKVFSFIGNTPPVSIVIKPGDKKPTPQIGKNDTLIAPAEQAKRSTPPKPAQAQPASPQLDLSASWPIHGTITTYFGQSDMPYQRYHTGIDISDGKRSGVTPIHPFKPGRVIEVIHSSVSLGNHVVLDHGNGITSVYGHMYSTSVSVGQMVDKNTVLGYEGTTGASTGPHVHFEIRINGQAVDPRKYVSGTP